MPRRRAVLLGAGLAAGGAVATAALGTTWFGGGRRTGDEPGQLRLATGPPGGIYREIGGELLKVLADRFPRTRLTEIQTGASIDNLALLASGGTELAFAYLDATVAGLAAGKPRDVTAVARLYDAWMHVIVPAASPVQAFADLDGRTVTAGAAGSGSRFTSERLFQLAGIRPRIVDASQAAGADLLAAGRVDAMLSFSGLLTPAVSRLAKAVDLRMIPLGRYTDAMVDRYGDFYTPAVLPAAVYPGLGATDTLTTPNLLLARPDLPDGVIELVAETLFTERARIARGHPDANGINVRTAIATAPVRLHPGALRYFRSVKL
jgi:TRAP transporter TAXI family solute receptor